MNNIEFADKLLHIVDRPNHYDNHYPANLGLYNDGEISFDCWNLIKALIWDNDIDSNYTEGEFAHPDFSTGLGDWNADQIVAHCDYISNDFSNVPIGAFLYYYDGSHAGAYIGDGKCVESTIGWGENGVIVTEVGANGERLLNGVQLGSWSKWAKMPWIDYIEECEACKVDLEEPVEEPVIEETPTEPLVEPKVNWFTLLLEVITNCIKLLFKKH